MSGTLDERDVAYEFHPVSAPRSLARQVVLLVGAVRSVVPWPRTGFIFAFVDLLDIRVDRRLRQQQTHLCVCVPEFDRYVSDELVFETDGHDARNGFYNGRFSVRDMPDGTCVSS